MKILIVDDEILICEALQRLLKQLGYRDVTSCVNSYEAEKLILKNLFDLVILDINMPERKGDELLKTVMEKGIKSEFIILSAVIEAKIIVDCLKSGAYDYIEKPVNFDFFKHTIKNVADHIDYKSSIEVFMSNENCKKPDIFNDFITGDLNLIKTMRYCERIASFDKNILITGETGTGKTLFARAIHDMSNRKNKNFVNVNISAIPEELFESTLFGHKKGSFTGAHNDREGFLSMADGGTLFLDEIGDIELRNQVKLLSVLENKEFYPVGSDKLKKSNFRLITATNANIAEKVEKGIFRSDLHYRIKTLSINLPPLRKRGNDIRLISDWIINDLNIKYNSSKKIGNSSYSNLMKHSFPGNFRELQQIIENQFFSNESGIIEFIDMDSSEKADDLRLSLEELKKRHILNLLETNLNKNEIAEILEISLRQLYSYIKKYDL